MIRMVTKYSVIMDLEYGGVGDLDSVILALA